MTEKKKTSPHHGTHSAGMGNDGGAAGSHEDTRHNATTRKIHTGHPDELEAFNEGPAGGSK